MPMKKRWHGIALSALAGLMAANVAGAGTALAATETVSLERLGVEDVILLPTISSQYVIQFSRPRTWKISPKSHLEVSFQHALQLQPHRSWLDIDLNERTLKRIPLTRENVDNTRLTLPLPVALLKDANTLTFRVQQHYTDRCEDPLDKSLWTQILPATRLVFEYEPVAPVVTLAEYPYPIIDSLTYSPARLRYVLASGASSATVQAMALLNVHLAQQAGSHEMMTRATFTGGPGPDDEHVLYVGTAAELAQAGNLPALSADYALQDGRWTNRRQSRTLSDDQGLILFARAPGSSRHAVLIVTGNTDQAVLKAARYLTTRPHADGLTNNAVETPSGWLPPDTRTAKMPRFIENESRTFRELELSTQEVHKINAPPIVYKVPIVTDFRRSDGRLWLDLSYSYGPGLNPTFSSLELRMNDVSIGNIQLTNPLGESLASASIPISGELIHPRNELVAQFHMMPDKYGWCVDNYVDNAWGKILDDSRFRVEGRPAGLLPDTSLLGAALFPYSREDNLERLQLVLPSSVDTALLNAMLGFTTRLGRATLADTDLRLSLSRDGAIDGDKNAVIFRHPNDLIHLPDGARLTWSLDGARRLSLADPAGSTVSAELTSSDGAAYLEQYALGGERVASVFTAHETAAFMGLARLFESDKAFDRLRDTGFLNQITPPAASIWPQPLLNAVGAIRYHQEGKTAETPPVWLSWLWDSPVGWLVKGVSGLVSGIWNVLWGAVSWVWDTLWGFVSGVWNAVWGWLTGLWPWH